MRRRSGRSPPARRARRPAARAPLRVPIARAGGKRHRGHRGQAPPPRADRRAHSGGPGIQPRRRGALALCTEAERSKHVPPRPTCSCRPAPKGRPCEFDHLERADQPPSVVGTDPVRGDRGPARRGDGGARRARRLRAPAPAATARPDPARELEVLDHARDIESGAAHQHRHRPRASTASTTAPGLTLIVGDAGLVPRVEHVEHVMRDAALGEWDLGRADVRPAVELHRIRIDDLDQGRQAIRQARATRLGLAGAGRTDDDEGHRADQPTCGGSGSRATCERVCRRYFATGRLGAIPGVAGRCAAYGHHYRHRRR